MKKLNWINLFVAILLFGNYSLVAQEEEREIVSKIGVVKIFLQGAEVFHTETIQMKTGRTKLVFTGLSPKLNPSSIRAEVANELVNVLSITSKTNFLKPQKESPEIRRLRDSLKINDTKIREIDNESDAYSKERDMILRNQSIGGANNGLTAAELQKMADFYRGRLLEINKKLSTLGADRMNLFERTTEINKQLNQLNARVQPTSEMYVTVEAKAPVSTSFSIHYLVSDCGWSPIYDLRAEDINKSIHLDYRALAYNNSGIDWKDIKVILSTADPMQTAAKPTMSPWYLNYGFQAYDIVQSQGYLNNIQQQNIAQKYNEQEQGRAELQYNDNNRISLNNNNDYRDGDGAGATRASSMANIAQVEVSEMNADFDIKDPYTIPSDDQPYSIDISAVDLKASYKHLTIPKVDRDAFMIAQVIGWESLDLISGPVNVYNSGRYIGQSFLNTRNLSDTLDLSLGRDQKVLVTRVKKDEMSSKQFFGGNKKIELAYTITVKNNHDQAIDIEILDQIPVSQDKEITVTTQEISGATLFPDTGKLKWMLHLGPGEKKALTLAFSIKYPKNKEVQLQKAGKMKAMRMW